MQAYRCVAVWVPRADSSVRRRARAVIRTVYYCLRARLVERPTSCACVKCGKRVAEMRRLATTTS